MEVAIANPPEWEEMQAWGKILGKESLFVDVGANVGTYSIWAADLGARVIAVEPMTDALKALDENASSQRLPVRNCECRTGEGPGRDENDQLARDQKPSPTRGRDRRRGSRGSYS